MLACLRPFASPYIKSSAVAHVDGWRRYVMWLARLHVVKCASRVDFAAGPLRLDSISQALNPSVTEGCTFNTHPTSPRYRSDSPGGSLASLSQTRWAGTSDHSISLVDHPRPCLISACYYRQEGACLSFLRSRRASPRLRGRLNPSGPCVCRTTASSADTQSCTDPLTARRDSTGGCWVGPTPSTGNPQSLTALVG